MILLVSWERPDDCGAAERPAGVTGAPTTPAEPVSPEPVPHAREELVPRVEPDLPVAEPLAAAQVIPAVPMLPEIAPGLVDEFQRRVGGETALEELQKQAQAALSILWAVLGGAVFIAGIARRVAAGRLFGLALLGLATAKVFIADLASLDAAYRVLSLHRPWTAVAGQFLGVPALDATGRRR